MTEHTLRTILIDLERAKTIEDVKSASVALLAALIQINAELENMRHPNGVRDALLKYTSK